MPDINDDMIRAAYDPEFVGYRRVACATLGCSALIMVGLFVYFCWWLLS